MRKGAKTAITTQARTMIKPSMAVGEDQINSANSFTPFQIAAIASSNCEGIFVAWGVGLAVVMTASRVAYPRIDERINDISNELRAHRQHDQHHRACFNCVHVFVKRGIQDEVSQTGVPKD